MPRIALKAFVGQSHWPQSKLRTATEGGPLDLVTLPTLDVWAPYRGRGLHVFLNPTLYHALKAFDPDVVIAGNSNFPNNVAVMAYCQRTHTPYIWHGIGSMYARNSRLRAITEPVLRAFFSRAVGGIAFNHQSRDYYVAKYGVDPSTIVVAPNVIDTRAVEANKKRWAAEVDKTRVRLGLNDKTVVLFVGALEPAKSIDRLIKVFSAMASDRTDLALLIVGDGRARSDLEELVRRLRMTSVHFLGQKQEDVDLYYMLGDIFVLPGLGGLALHHAMTHGLPVLAAEADGSARDLLLAGENGFLLDEQDALTDLQDKLELLTRNDVQRRQMGAASKKLVDEKFNLQSTVDIVYEGIMAALDLHRPGKISE